MDLTIVYDFFMYISLFYYLTTCAAMFLFLICI